MNKEIVLHDLGRVNYSAGERIQELLKQDVQSKGRQHIVALEHNPVFTLGKNADRNNLLWTEEELTSRRIQLFETSRGGDITYHGPGQIVIYPILNLNKIATNLGNFVRGLEESMIRTNANYGIDSQQIKGDSGVWVKNGDSFLKIGAIGLHVSNWISTHGIAYNVNPDLNHYMGMNPCGFQDRGVASLASLLPNKIPDLGEVKSLLIKEICSHFQLSVQQATAPTRSVSVIVFRNVGNDIEILMIKRVPEDGGWWQSVTGMIDEGETEAQAGLREVLEETGLTGDLIDLNYQHTFIIPKDRLDYPFFFNREYCFALRVHNSYQQVILAPAEHESHEWASIAKAKNLTPWDGMRIAIDHLTNILCKTNK